MRFSCFPPSADSESSTLDRSDPMAGGGSQSTARPAAAVTVLLVLASPAACLPRACVPSLAPRSRQVASGVVPRASVHTQGKGAVQPPRSLWRIGRVRCVMSQLCVNGRPWLAADGLWPPPCLPAFRAMTRGPAIDRLKARAFESIPSRSTTQGGGPPRQATPRLALCGPRSGGSGRLQWVMGAKHVAAWPAAARRRPARF